MWINKTNGASYNFVAPGIESDTEQRVEVIFPTYAAQSLTIASNKALANIERTHELITVGAAALEADCTLTATPAVELPAGSVMVVRFSCGATKYDMTVKKSASDTGVKLTGVASSTVAKQLLWDGSNWIVLS